MNPLTAIKQRLCKHDEDKLRFLYVISPCKCEYVNSHLDKFWYKCTKCGKRISKDRPINCTGCVSAYNAQSGVHCLDGREMEKLCLRCERKYFMPAIKIDND